MNTQSTVQFTEIVFFEEMCVRGCFQFVVERLTHCRTDTMHLGGSTGEILKSYFSLLYNYQSCVFHAYKKLI